MRPRETLSYCGVTIMAWLAPCAQIIPCQAQVWPPGYRFNMIDDGRHHHLATARLFERGQPGVELGGLVEGKQLRLIDDPARQRREGLGERGGGGQRGRVPADGRLHLQGAQPLRGTLRLHDPLGRQLATWPAAGQLTQTLNMPPALPSGTYLLTLESPNLPPRTLRLVQP